MVLKVITFDNFGRELFGVINWSAVQAGADLLWVGEVGVDSSVTPLCGPSILGSLEQGKKRCGGWDDGRDEQRHKGSKLPSMLEKAQGADTMGREVSEFIMD